MWRKCARVAGAHPGRGLAIGAAPFLLEVRAPMEPEKIKHLLAMSGFGAVTVAAAALAAQFKPGAWYRGLHKPWYQPPRWVFAPVWTALYTLMATSGYRVWRSPPSADRTRALGFWGAQLGLNVAWTWLFFGQQSPRAALLDIGLLRVAIEGYSTAARSVVPDADWMIAPYRGWVSFATLLNADIARHNP